MYKLVDSCSKLRIILQKKIYSGNKLHKLHIDQFNPNSIIRKMSDKDDYLYYSNDKLKGLISSSKDVDQAIRTYLDTVRYAPIKDFTENLEWFNVSEGLSFNKHLRGKLVLLDFFTYCCINCMHILPDLRAIEEKFSIKDGLVVIGVHSAKFENEKSSQNVLAAVQRYDIMHPVINDCNSEMWQNCDVHCWPTLLLLGPNANPIVMLTGEGHKEDLMDYIRVTLQYYKEKRAISEHTLPLKPAYHLLPALKGPLLFPGKISIFQETVAISDTGNHRILIGDCKGTIRKIIGSGRKGFKDGPSNIAEFQNPQGLTFYDANVIFVADTDNHAIRRINLLDDKVETVAGTGEQGHDRIGGNFGISQIISSPWDVSVYRTANMDLTFHPDGRPPLKEMLLIAMAGTHQIWALFLDETVWWKCKKYSKGSCVAIAGSGREENRNNVYPHAAAFAQPSGLAVDLAKKELFVADSESSSIRRISLLDGKVTAVVGGDINPSNLFAFGDKDGSLYDAKLQHALGIAIPPVKDEENAKNDFLYVCDTYNHKLKRINLATNSIMTLLLSAQASNSANNNNNKTNNFFEPSGLCVCSDRRTLLVCDTNNHEIKSIYLNTKFSAIERIESVKLTFNDDLLLLDTNKSVLNLNQHRYKILCLENKLGISSKGGKIVFKLILVGIKVSTEAPQQWTVDVPNSLYSVFPKCGTNVQNVDVLINVPPANNNNNHHREENVLIKLNFISCKKNNLCIPIGFLVKIPICCSVDGETSVEKQIEIAEDENEENGLVKIINCK